ncbi:MAG: Rieske (2Fe-2S) protein, partial [Alphaproteobacteria bacterium]
MFVVRRGSEIHAYVNVCPHFGTLLNDQAATFLTADSARIRCTKYFSKYRLEDGFGIAGHGEGCWFDRVPVVVE